MSDLSRLLDDVYEQPVAKDDAKGWTSDEALDSAFSDWVPGPGEDASEKERSLFAGAKPRPDDESDPITDENVGELPTTGLAAQVAPDDTVQSDPPSDRIASETGTTEVLDAIPVDDAPTMSREWASANAVPTDVTPAPVVWRPVDDDILPARANRRFLGLSLHR
jgi:hypothetical protein